MAFVVSRPHGRWEIRESYATDDGPRARTLASFRSLSPAVIERASRSAHTPFDPARIVRAAKRAGVPFEPSPGDSLAEALLRSVTRGANVRPGLRRLIHDRFRDVGARSVDESLADWIGATLEERGAALVDLLGLADRLPKPRRGKLRFPGLSPSRLRA
jgi:hypothetical protein